MCQGYILLTDSMNWCLSVLQLRGRNCFSFQNTVFCFRCKPSEQVLTYNNASNTFFFCLLGTLTAILFLMFVFVTGKLEKRQQCLHTCMTFMDAAPARPTFIVTGFTRADLAKFCIFLGIVAENKSVWRWPWTVSNNISHMSIVVWGCKHNLRQGYRTLQCCSWHSCFVIRSPRFQRHIVNDSYWGSVWLSSAIPSKW
jgi:hypothetical protein